MMKALTFILIISSYLWNSISIYTANHDIFFYTMNHKIGIFGASGISFPKYDAVEPFVENTAVVWKNHQCGLINANGKEIISCIFEEIQYFDDILVFEDNEGSLLVKRNGEILVSLEDMEVLDYHQNTIAVEDKETGLCGIMSIEGQTIAANEWYLTSAYYDGMAIVVDSQYCYNLIDFLGNSWLENFVDYCDPFFINDMTVIYNSEKQYLVNSKGKYIIANGYDEITILNENLCWLRDGEKKEIYIVSEHKFVDCLWDRVFPFQDGYALIQLDNMWGMINDNFDTILPCEYQEVSLFSENVTLVKKNNRYMYMDPSGNQLFDADFDEACTFSEGLAAVKIDKKWGFINHEGNFVIYPTWEGNGRLYFYDGICLIIDSLTNWATYIDKNGHIIIEYSYLNMSL